VQGEYNSHGYDVAGFNKDGYDKYGGQLAGFKARHRLSTAHQQLPAKPA
jgi:hypothetical protein